jgi:HPr kinase/phosphorylase
MGPSGAGKSDLLLRLVDRGFSLVADDQVDIEAGYASAPAPLEGLVEAWGLGIVRLPHRAHAKVALVVRLQRGERLPMPARYDDLDLPMVCLDPWNASAPLLVELALDGALGRLPFVAGAFG